MGKSHARLRPATVWELPDLVISSPAELAPHQSCHQVPPVPVSCDWVSLHGSKALGDSGTNTCSFLGQHVPVVSSKERVEHDEEPAPAQGQFVAPRKPALGPCSCLGHSKPLLLQSPLAELGPSQGCSPSSLRKGRTLKALTTEKPSHENPSMHLDLPRLPDLPQPCAMKGSEPT